MSRTGHRADVDRCACGAYPLSYDMEHCVPYHTQYTVFCRRRQAAGREERHYAQTDQRFSFRRPHDPCGRRVFAGQPRPVAHGYGHRGGPRLGGGDRLRRTPPVSGRLAHRPSARHRQDLLGAAHLRSHDRGHSDRRPVRRRRGGVHHGHWRHTGGQNDRAGAQGAQETDRSCAAAGAAHRGRPGGDDSGYADPHGRRVAHPARRGRAGRRQDHPGRYVGRSVRHDRRIAAGGQGRGRPGVFRHDQPLRGGGYSCVPRGGGQLAAKAHSARPGGGGAPRANPAHCGSLGELSGAAGAAHCARLLSVPAGYRRGGDGARGVLPLRARTRHAHGDHGRHRAGHAAWRRHQIRRGARAHGQGRYRRV